MLVTKYLPEEILLQVDEETKCARRYGVAKFLPNRRQGRG